MVYTDGNYEDPRLNRIISIHLNDETDIDFTRELVYDSERGRISYEQAGRIAESVFGQEYVLREDYGVRGTAREWTEGGTYRERGEADRGNRGGRRYSLNTSAYHQSIAEDLADQLLGDDGALQKVYDTFMKVAGEKGIAVDVQHEKFSINPDVYNLNREQYNKWGWATRNNVLTPNELDQIESRSRKDFGGQNPGIETADGFWALPVGNVSGIDNVIAVTDRNLGNQDIARVYRIDSMYEDDLDIVRRLIYATEETYGKDASRACAALLGTGVVNFYDREDYLNLYEERRRLGSERNNGGKNGGRFESLQERKRRIGELDNDDAYSLNSSAYHQSIAEDLADQLIGTEGNAESIASVLAGIDSRLWRDHRQYRRTGDTTTADRNPIEILSDLTRSISVGYNPGGSMSNGNRRLPRAVRGFYDERARSITTQQRGGRPRHGAA